MRAALILAALCAPLVLAGEDAVRALTPDDFDSFVGGDKAAFVEFYAPWCGHCKNLAPEYEKVGSTFKPSDGVVIAKVDADAHRDLGSRFGVSGFPTLKWFPKGSSKPEDYEGGRTAADIVSFVNGKMGLNRKVKEVPTAVAVLTPDNFDAIALDPKKDVLVEFYAPWCGHCKALAPKYEIAAASFAGEPNVVIASVDADKYRDLGSRYGVTGFPTLKFFPRGEDKEAEDYGEGRDEESIVDFMNKKAGTKRTVGGGLTADAGRLADFDDYAKQFMKKTGDARSAVLKEAQGSVSILTPDEAGAAQMYTKIMEKTIEKGDKYPATELKRLEAMIASDSISAVKKTLFQLRANVLRAFTDEE